MTVRVRIAPSPTGKLHVGNVRTALVNWLFAKSQGGEFMLRIDDTDLERSKKAFEEAIEADFRWMGLNWDLTDRQSARFSQYDAARDKLVTAGLLYPCYETEDELDRKRKIAQSRGRPPLYDRAALSLTNAEKAAFEAEGRKPHWRYKLSGRRVEWDDVVRGRQSIDTASQSDPVLIRADGAYLYTLPSVVDDIDFAISHIIRGEDHVTNTGVQIEIFEALGAKAPQFAHLPLLVGAEGEGLSKRLGSLSIESLREAGIESMAIASHLAKLGTSDPIEARHTLAALVAEFDFAKMGRAPARFDPDELERVNAALLHTMSYASVQARLGPFDADLGEAFWLAVRGNLTKISDAEGWAQVVRGPITPIRPDPTFTEAAATVLPNGPFTLESWSVFTEAVKQKTGAKGKALFMPLRQALTGRDHGPEMAGLFALIGADKAHARLLGQSR